MCHYPVQVPENSVSKDTTSLDLHSPRENVINFAQHSQVAETLPAPHPLNASSNTPPPTGCSPSSDTTNTTDPPSESINLAHMDLLIHVTQDSDMFNLGAGIESYHPSGLALGLKQALAHPYLMYELLAFSALHLAHLNSHPSTQTHLHRSSHYLHLSVRLQTRAISLFNDTLGSEGVTESNCVAIVLFSSILGHHVLASTLTFRAARSAGPEEVDKVVAQWVQCMDTHRGIHTIATSSWPALMASDLAPILTQSQEFTSRTPVGRDCDVLKRRVEVSSEMEEEEKEACSKAIGYLQVGFDASSEKGFPEGESGKMENKHHMIYTWTMLVPREVTGLLMRKRPEALALLAYYAVLLHRGRELWQVGGVGRYLFEIMDGYLGKEWDEVLTVPRRELM